MRRAVYKFESCGRRERRGGEGRGGKRPTRNDPAIKIRIVKAGEERFSFGFTVRKALVETRNAEAASIPDVGTA